MACFNALIFNGFCHFLRWMDQFWLELGHCLTFLLVGVGGIIWCIAWLATRLVGQLAVLVHASFLGELRRLQILDQAILNASRISSCVDVNVVRSLSVWSKVEDSILAYRILGSLILAVSLLTRWTVCRDPSHIGHVNWGVHMLFRVVFESTFICYHNWLHMRRWCAINWMAWIEAGKHITLASCLVWIVEHTSLGLLFIHWC